MDKYVLDIKIKIIDQGKGITTTEVKDVVGTFFVKLRGLKKNMIIKMNNSLWMKMIMILVENRMVSITRGQSWSYMMLVVKKI